MADPMKQAREAIADWHRQKGCSQQVIDDCLSGVITVPDFYMDLITAALLAAPEGFVMVPELATEDMLVAGFPHGEIIDESFDPQGAWADMLAARPQGVR